MSLKGPHKFNGELDPSANFLSNNSCLPAKRQYDGLKRVAEGLRTIGAHITGARVNGVLAHAMLDDLIRMSQMGQVRFSDVHIRDTGATSTLCKAFEQQGVYTVGDLANCHASKLPGSVDLMDALHVTLSALRRIMDLERERQG